jgi:hypothetical protein
MVRVDVHHRFAQIRKRLLDRGQGTNSQGPGQRLLDEVVAILTGDHVPEFPKGRVELCEELPIITQWSAAFHYWLQHRKRPGL